MRGWQKHFTSTIIITFLFLDNIRSTKIQKKLWNITIWLIAPLFCVLLPWYPNKYQKFLKNSLTSWLAGKAVWARGRCAWRSMARITDTSIIVNWHCRWESSTWSRGLRGVQDNKHHVTLTLLVTASRDGSGRCVTKISATNKTGRVGYILISLKATLCIENYCLKAMMDRLYFCCIKHTKAWKFSHLANDGHSAQGLKCCEIIIK